MKKIPTIFLREGKFVVPQANPKASNVFQQETIARRKYNGICFMFDGHTWHSRSSMPGRVVPKMSLYHFIPVEYDPDTQKTFGWTDDGSFNKYLKIALNYPPLHADLFPVTGIEYEPGTYELVGAKINGNPEGICGYRLVSHEYAEQMSDINALVLHTLTPQEAFDRLQQVLRYQLVEGIVFYMKDTPIGKIKQRDFDYAQISD